MTALQKTKSNILNFEITDIFFAFSLFASFSTYFRFEGLPIGLFEVSNIIFIFLSIQRKLLEWRKPYIKEVMCWWGIFLSFSSLATILLISIDNRPYLIHDFLAYIYSGTLSVFYLSYKRSLYKIIIYMLCIVVFFLIIAFFIGDFYTTNNRFMGFSKNPNQLGLCFSIVSFLVMKQIKNITYGKIEIFIIIGCCILSFYSRSNSQILTYAFVPLFLLYSKYDKNQCSKFLGILLLLLIFLGGYVFYLGTQSAIKETFNTCVYSELFIRFEIWKIYLFTCMNFPLGFGLGSIILIPKSLINKYLNPTLNAMYFDPHNSFVNYLYIAGVVPVYLLLKKISCMLQDFYIKNEIHLFFGFLSILVVMSFHNFTRQPILYFYLIYFIREHYYLKIDNNQQKEER